MKLNKKIIVIIIVVTLIITSFLLIFNFTDVFYKEYSGVVLDYADESPIPNAKIEIFTASYGKEMHGSDKEHYKTIYTDSNGKYKVKLKPLNNENWMYIFHTSKEGYVNAYSHSYDFPNNNYDGRQRLEYKEDMYLMSTGSLSGRVNDDNNNPIVNANVVVMKEPPRGNIKDILMATTTNTLGQYSLDYLWAIDCYIAFSAYGSEQQVINNFKINKFTQNKLNVSLLTISTELYNVSGNITFDEKPFAYSHIVYVDENNNMYFTKCDSAGYYRINVKASTYNIHHCALWYDNRNPEYYSEYSYKDTKTITSDTNLDINVWMTYDSD